MSLPDLIALLALVAVGAFWIDALAVREIALAAAREACQREGKQFLDEGIAARHLRLLRNTHGQLCLGRTYHFEYSDTSQDRRRGTIVTLGREVVMVNVGLTRVH